MPARSNRPTPSRSPVAQLEALVRSDQAAIDNAQATLGYTKIIAPLSGRAGLRQIDQGNIIHASDATGLVVITQLQPIAVQFSLPQQQIVRVNAAHRQGRRWRSMCSAMTARPSSIAGR